MRHLDLFSGIGGFALAARNVWGKEYHNVCFCEINKYAQAVLRKNFGKDVVICDDIRLLTNANSHGSYKSKDSEGNREGTERDKKRTEKLCEPERGYSLRTEDVADSNIVKSNQGRRDNEKVRRLQKKESKSKHGPVLSWRSHKRPNLRIDLLTGGFPCQPFSQAGQRRGAEDDRFLWPEMLRVISEFRPTWIIGENVAGLLSMAEFDGESEVATETDLFGNKSSIHTKRGRGILFRIIGELEQIGYSVQAFVIPACAVNAPHRRDRVWIVAHSQRTELPGKRRTPRGWRPEHRCDAWRENWLEVATRFCGVDDGLCVGMDGLELTSAGHRVERLKALGNAIVPQVAEQIMRAIKEIL